MHGDSLMPVTRLAPSAWASYLINGDASGLEPSERRQAELWIAREGIGFPCDCEDAGFWRNHDAYTEMPYSADCQRYTFLVPGIEP